jgi:hypothetical protein
MIKPTDEQLEEFGEMFGDVLSNHEHEPRKFLYYWEMYLQVKDNEEFNLIEKGLDTSQ